MVCWIVAILASRLLVFSKLECMVECFNAGSVNLEIFIRHVDPLLNVVVDIAVFLICRIIKGIKD